MIPAHAPPHDIHELLNAAFSTLGNGCPQKRFESMVKKCLQTERYLTTISGRRALYIGLKSIGVGEGDEVIIPAFTTDIIPLVIRATGAVPIPVDVDLRDYNISPHSVLDQITPKTRAVLAVHSFGCPADMRSLQDICWDHNLFLIEDAAPAFGARYFGKPAGTFGDFSILSYGIGKSISMGVGGGIVAQDSGLFEKIKERSDLSKSKNSLGVFMKILGSIVLSNPHMYSVIGRRIKDLIVARQYDGYTNEICDRSGIPKLSYEVGIREIKSDIIEKRRTIAQEYSGLLKGFPGVKPPPTADGFEPVYSRYFVRFDSEKKRDLIRKRLRSYGVETIVPDYGYPISSGLYASRLQDKIPNSRTLSKTLLGIPIHKRINQGVLEAVFSTS